MNRVVVAAYRPKPGLSGELEKLIRAHHNVLVQERLADPRAPYIIRASDQTIVEIYLVTESYSKSTCIKNARVRDLWRLMDDICTYVPPGRLEEMQALFPEFTLIK